MKQNYEKNSYLRAAFTRWLETLLRNERCNYLRSIARRMEVSVEETEIPDLPQADDMFLDESDPFAFENENLRQAFDQLPPAWRDVLVRIYVKKQTADEIAQEQNCTLQNVYNKHSLALRALRNALQKGDRT